MTVLQVTDVAVTYRRVRAVASISFAARPGEPVAVLGRNGAGKSSVLGAISGMVRPASGHVGLDDLDVTSWSADRRARAGVALVPEGRRIFPKLSVEENLRLGGFWLDGGELAESMLRVFDLFSELRVRLGAPAGQLSGGQQQMLAVGRALMAQPKVLLLDEPSLGLAPAAIADVYARLEVLREQGLTIVLVEQQVHRALHFATDAIVLHEGRVAAHEPPDALLEDPRLLGAYLGSRPT